MRQLTLRLLRFTYKKLKEKLTVSDSKTLFHEQFPYVIPSLYKRIVDEMLVELNLLNHQSEFTQDSYFCVGLTETFKELTNGYEPKEQLSGLFNALCNSTNFIPNEVKEISEKALEEYSGKDTKEIFNLIVENNSSKNYYSRIFILGVYKILTLANDFKDEEDMSKFKILSEISNKLELPLSRAEKDIGLYKSSIKKFEQAKELLRETILNEREKRKK
tara:strand:- start:14789 stop:15442 length:654 start_codon:yes stop_codon:yes gene_type:complete